MRHSHERTAGKLGRIGVVEDIARLLHDAPAMALVRDRGSIRRKPCGKASQRPERMGKCALDVLEHE